MTTFHSTGDALWQRNEKCESGENQKPIDARPLEHMSRLPATGALFCLVTLLLIGCDRASKRAERANDVYREALSAERAGDQSQAIALLGQAMDVKPEAFMYLKRAELYLKTGDDTAATADIDMARQLGGARVESDCQWLLDEAAKPAERRFQGNAAAAPSLNK